MQPLPPFKRVVTGHDIGGSAFAALVGTVPHSFALAAVPGTVFHEVWNSSASPVVLDNGGDPTGRPLQLSPDPLGSVIRVVDIPPDNLQAPISAQHAAAVFAEIGQASAGTASANARHSLMHRTQTLDYGIVTEGEVWLVLESEDVLLRRGDVVVQRGTNHAWSNRTDSMARMVFILLDGRYTPALQEVLQ